MLNKEIKDHDFLSKGFCNASCSHNFASNLLEFVLPDPKIQCVVAGILLHDSRARDPGSIPGPGHMLSILLPQFQEGQLSVSGESMCTKYWLTA